MDKIIRETYSVCPVCGAQIMAQLICTDGCVYMQKRCAEHGDFSTIVWKNNYDLISWYGNVEPISDWKCLYCPRCMEAGLCTNHLNDTCCVLFEVTSRCNLRCKFCFADNHQDIEDLSVNELRIRMYSFVKPGRTLIQLSGGEPTVRDDLPEIVKCAVDLGCRYVQLNSNAIRLAEDEDYVRRLAEAGLSFVFMQFDGMNDDIYIKLCGRLLLNIKKKAIENCAKYGIGVTLVPTVVPGVNTEDIGNILRFAVYSSPAVRGVHFQPVTYMGRIPFVPDDSLRCTLDELIAIIVSQSCGLVMAENLQPSRCDHPLCGFHGDFVVQKDGKLFPLTQKRGDAECCCGSESPAVRNREFVGRRWKRVAGHEAASCCCYQAEKDGDMTDIDYFLDRVKKFGFTITSMAFQDAENIDLERLRMCSLHVYDFKSGKLVPFCAHYLTLRK